MRLRKYVRKEVYRDLMFAIGQSYMPDDVLEEDEDLPVADGDDPELVKLKQELQDKK